MWTRRIDLGICEPLANGFRYSDAIEMFRPRMRVIPEAAEGLKGCAQDIMTWLDGQMDGKTWICGDRFTLADILLFCFVDFGAKVGQKIDPGNANLTSWYERTKERPSASA